MSRQEELMAEIRRVKMNKDKYLARVDGELRDLHHELKTCCLHPDATEYTWEWDCGYGKQENITGLRCDYCGAKRGWKTMGTWFYED